MADVDGGVNYVTSTTAFAGFQEGIQMLPSHLSRADSKTEAPVWKNTPLPKKRNNFMNMNMGCELFHFTAQKMEFQLW